MARGKIYNEHLLMEFSKRYADAENKADKGEVVQWFMNETGVSLTTAYRVINRISSGAPFADVAGARQRRKKRKDDLQRARDASEMKKIISIKYISGQDKKKRIPTVYAIRMAESAGHVPAGKYNRSRVDRFAREQRLDHRSMKKEHVAWKLTAKYPTRVFVVDATPMDQYYIRLDGRIKRYDMPDGDTHRDDILARERLSKIWVYYGVDMHSKSFLAMPYAALPITAGARNPGESAETWLEFLKFFMLNKRDLQSPLESKPAPLLNCPIEGIPHILYCDRGSGIGKSNRVNSLCRKLGTQIITHLPGNPSAKGIVESRISAFKRSFETQFLPDKISNINELVYLYLAWGNWWCEQRGYYAAWQRGIVGHDIHRVTDETFRDANISHFIRTIDGFGCVDIDKQKWFVTWDEHYKKSKVKIYRPQTHDGEVRYMAELNDGTLIDCRQGMPEHDFEDIKSHPKSAGQRNREDLTQMTRQIKGTLIYDDMLPPSADEKLVRFPHSTRETEVHSPIKDSFDSVKKAWNWILNQTALTMEDISPESYTPINKVLEISLEEHGYIPGETARLMSNLINKNKKKEVIGEL